MVDIVDCLIGLMSCGTVASVNNIKSFEYMDS